MHSEVTGEDPRSSDTKPAGSDLVYVSPSSSMIPNCWYCGRVHALSEGTIALNYDSIQPLHRTYLFFLYTCNDSHEREGSHDSMNSPTLAWVSLVKPLWCRLSLHMECKAAGCGPYSLLAMLGLPPSSPSRFNLSMLVYDDRTRLVEQCYIFLLNESRPTITIIIVFWRQEFHSCICDCVQQYHRYIFKRFSVKAPPAL